MPVGHGTFVVAGMPQDELSPTIAMAPDGRFDIAYEYAYSPSDHDIYLARYTAAGAFAGTSYVNVDTNFETEPSVSMDNAGNAVVAYVEAIGLSTGIFADRVSAAGLVGLRITVAYGGGISYFVPSVALSPTTAPSSSPSTPANSASRAGRDSTHWSSRPAIPRWSRCTTPSAAPMTRRVSR